MKRGEVIDPKKVKHADVTALKISNISGWIDPVTHLNLDFPRHLIREVNVAENLDIGSNVLLDGERFMTARLNPSSYQHLGFIDESERAEQLRTAVHEAKLNKR